MKFAELELRIATIKMFQKFSFKLDESKKFRSINMLIHTPEDLYLNLTPRDVQQ